ncbi:MAG: hypothetical protein M3R27_00700 [Bacteroidota bacterium]|nr:hypothetical protein [Bacteroidota bacterium]
MKQACFLFFFLISSNFFAEEKASYTIEVAGVEIGMLYTSRFEKEGLTYYSFDSNVDVWLFKRIIVSHKMICIYNKEHLLSVTVNSVANGEQYFSNIKWNKDHYDVDVKTYKYTNNKPINEKITFGVVKLFYEAPLDHSKILAENYGVFANVTELSSEYYQVHVIDKKNKYTYKKGELIKAEMESPIKNFIIKKIK